MKFSIVTPSFNSGQWLPLCIASVADQTGVEHEHIVQDAQSTDGTLEWLPTEPRVKAYVEKDEGMYDAVMRGFRRAEGDVLAYLNCDEQYLPGALASVAEYLAAHPEVEVAIAHFLVVDTEGRYLCHRHNLTPIHAHIWSRFNVNTSALFIRREVLQRPGLEFDHRWRFMGDFFWVEAAVRAGVKFGVLPRLTSVFTETGENLSLRPGMQLEEAERRRRTPKWVRPLRALWILHHQWRTIRSGAFGYRPFTYEIYTQQSPQRRVTMRAKRPTPLWPGRGRFAAAAPGEAA